MISKELLSEVLNLNMWKTETITLKYDCNKIEWNGTFLGDCGYYKSFDYINIYELAHKCKEWAFSNNYLLSSGIDTQNNYFECEYFCFVHRRNKSGSEFLYEYWDEDEPIAIFKACQWILDNKDK